MNSQILKSWQTDSGLYARVIENTFLLHLCGYVGVNKDFCFYEVDYSEIDSYISVHGGVTFSGFFEDSDLWWIGYDCGHSSDQNKFNPSGVLRDLNYCVKECESLAKQINSFYKTPLDYLLRSNKIGRLPELMHNQMIAWAIENPKNEIIKKYFQNIKCSFPLS